MREIEPETELVANILLGDGQSRDCRVIVKGCVRHHGVRIEMIDAAPEVGLPAGAQTIIGWDRIPA